MGRAYIAAKYLKPAEEEKARERQLAAQNNDAGRAVQEKLPEQVCGQARDLAAAQVGLSGKTVDAAAKAIEDGIPAGGMTITALPAISPPWNGLSL